MTAGRLIFPGLMPCINADGDRMPGARAYFYANLSTTPATTYADSGLSVPNANPVIADGVGTWPAMWADTATLFTVALTDADGVPLPNAAWDGVSAAIDATLASVALALAAEAAAEAAAGNALVAQVLAQAAAATVTGAPFSATSVTSLTVGTGNKTFTLQQTGKLFSKGQTVVIAETSAPAIQMTGVITDFDPATGIMTVNSAVTAGAGTHADWTISLSSSGGVLSVAGLAGVVTAAALKGALAIATTDLTDIAAFKAQQLALAVAMGAAL